MISQCDHHIRAYSKHKKNFKKISWQYFVEKICKQSHKTTSFFFSTSNNNNNNIKAVL